MNKWSKFATAGFAVMASAQAPAEEMVNQIWNAESLDAAISLDAVDLAGGSKLKDRMIELADYELEMAFEILQG